MLARPDDINGNHLFKINDSFQRTYSFEVEYFSPEICFDESERSSKPLR